MTVPDVNPLGLDHRQSHRGRPEFKALSNGARTGSSSGTSVKEDSYLPVEV